MGAVRRSSVRRGSKSHGKAKVFKRMVAVVKASKKTTPVKKSKPKPVSPVKKVRAKSVKAAQKTASVRMRRGSVSAKRRLSFGKSAVPAKKAAQQKRTKKAVPKAGPKSSGRRKGSVSRPITSAARASKNTAVSKATFAKMTLRSGKVKVNRF